MPKGLKIFIAVAIIFVGGGLLLSLGGRLIGGLFSGPGSDNMAREGIAAFLEEQARRSGKDVDIDFKDGKVVVTDEESGEKIEVKMDDQGMVMKNQQSGEQLTFRTGTEIPSSFPKEIDHPGNATVISSAMIGPMTSIRLEAPMTINDARDFYANEFAENGWKKLYETTAEQHTVSVFKNDSGQFTLNINRSDEKGPTEVALTYTPTQVK